MQRHGIVFICIFRISHKHLVGREIEIVKQGVLVSVESRKIEREGVSAADGGGVGEGGEGRVGRAEVPVGEPDFADERELLWGDGKLRV